jgi:molybdate-binding protein
MDNQHRKIKGYRELSQPEIDAMNAVKQKAAEVGELIRELSENEDLDQRWVNIAKTDLQKGFMAATRSIAKPDFF